MAAPLQDIFSLLSWGGGTDEYGNPSYQQTGADPSTVLATGALTPTARDSQGNVAGGQGFQVDWSKLPKTAAGTTAAGWTPWGPDASKLINSKYLINDPNYGWITPGANIKRDSDFLTTLGNMMPLIIATLAGGAILNPAMLGPGFTGGLGSIAGGGFKAIENLLFQKGG